MSCSDNYKNYYVDNFSCEELSKSDCHQVKLWLDDYILSDRGMILFGLKPNNDEIFNEFKKYCETAEWPADKCKAKLNYYIPLFVKYTNEVASKEASNRLLEEETQASKKKALGY